MESPAVERRFSRNERMHLFSYYGKPVFSFGGNGRGAQTPTSVCIGSGRARARLPSPNPGRGSLASSRGCMALLCKGRPTLLFARHGDSMVTRGSIRSKIQRVACRFFACDFNVVDAQGRQQFCYINDGTVFNPYLTEKTRRMVPSFQPGN